jgi:hypothetical protein
MSGGLGRLAAFGGGLVGFVLLFAFVGIIGSCLITLAIWPGELKLLAPILCSDAQPDAFVVADTYNPRPGETSTNFTLYCMGPRGDSTDVGFLRPFLMISVVNGLVIMLPFVLVAIGLRASLGRPAERLRRSSRDDGAVAHHSDTAGVEITSGSGPDGHGPDGHDPDGEQTDDAARRDRSPGRPPPGSTAGPFVD